MGKAKRHIHKYHKVTTGYTTLWACAFPDCSHFMPKHIENNVIGKASICWHCSSNLILNSENMKDDKPICSSCKLGLKPDDEIELPLSSAMLNRLTEGK